MTEKYFDYLWLAVKGRKPLPHQYLARVEDGGETRVIIDLTTREIHHDTSHEGKRIIFTEKMKNRT